VLTNPKLPKRKPREIPDERWRDVFAWLRSNRDRAVLAVTISVRCVDLDWGDQLVQVIRKGTWDEQWLPVSTEAFVWIRLYLNDLGMPLDPNERLWWTLRRRNRGVLVMGGPPLPHLFSAPTLLELGGTQSRHRAEVAEQDPGPRRPYRRGWPASALYA
jgi:hypothetical protein